MIIASAIKFFYQEDKEQMQVNMQHRLDALVEL